MREGWTYKKLGEVGSFVRGNGFLKSDFVKSGFPCIHYGQIHTIFGVAVDKHITEIPKSLISKTKIAQTGDIILAITSEDVECSCKCTAWLGDYEVAVGAHAAIYKHNLLPKYVSYYFRSSFFAVQKEKYTHGSKVVEIKPSDIATITIPLPPKSQQEAIVSELDEINSLLALKREQLQTYDKLAQSLFYEMFGDPVENEKGWEVKKFKDSFKLKSGDGLSAKDFQEGVFPVYGGNGISGYHNAYNMDGKYIIIGRVGVYCGNVRNVAGKFWLTDNAFELFYNKDSFNDSFLCQLLNHLKLRQYANAAAQPVISNTTLKDINIPLPPLSLQQQFATRIAQIEEQKQQVQAAIERLETLLASRMQYWFE